MSVLTRTDVTAVKLLKTHILIGIGSYIHIYDRKTLQLKERLQALEAQKIHGFSPNHNEQSIITFGGKQFTVLLIKSGGDSDYTFNIDKSSLCDDWLHSVVWFKGSKIAVLTAHNVVQIWKTDPPALVSTHKSKYNSILYSALLLPYDNDLLIFAGTVYSEVIIQICGEEEALHRLKGHKGVIFSISYDFESQYLITSSDDRSVRVWSPNYPVDSTNDAINYWKNVTLECKYELYGHTARAMRNTFTKKYIVSVGEDGGICYWDKSGVLVSKRTAHQGGSIWSVDGDEVDIITGGGDGAVTLHPLTALNNKAHEALITDVGTPKHLFFTARKNLVILNDDSELIQYDTENSEVIMRMMVKRESTFQIMSLSSCKQIVAVIDMMGNLHICMEPCKDIPNLVNILNTKLNIVDKVLSMHWINNRHLVICTENGNIKVIGTKDSEIDNCDDFTLPHCKERWLTAAAANENRSIYIFGDRCGNIHIYETGQKVPIKTFHKIHGNYGPTSITINADRIITTGRNAAIQYFSFDYKDTVKVMHKKVINFKWVEKFLDKNETLVCGFQERDFVVTDIVEDTKLIEVHCGGGHRAWDAVRYHDTKSKDISELVTLSYVKNSNIHLVTYELNTIKPKSIVPGTHVKKINCAKILTVNGKIYIISGGEDTSLRISTLDNNEFKDIFIFKHLSSVKTIRTHKIECTHWAPFDPSTYLLVSAGGRAQICIKTITFNDTQVHVQDIVDYMIKGQDKNRPCNQNWKTHSIDFDPETRIMDLEIYYLHEELNPFYIVVACSDSVIRVYNLGHTHIQCPYDIHAFKLVNEIKYHDTCVLKTCQYDRLYNRPGPLTDFNKQTICENLFCAVTTKGEMSIWDVEDLILDDGDKKPKFTFQNVHKSGINCVTQFFFNCDFYTVTGGDDNSIVISQLRYNIEPIPAFIHGLKFIYEDIHSAQVTGSLYYEQNIVTASIDQMINVMPVDYKQGIMQEYATRTDISDVSGIEFLAFDSETQMMKILVYGKGFEVINVRYIKTPVPNPFLTEWIPSIWNTNYGTEPTVCGNGFPSDTRCMNSIGQSEFYLGTGNITFTALT